MALKVAGCICDSDPDNCPVSCGAGVDIHPSIANLALDMEDEFRTNYPEFYSGGSAASKD